MVLVSLPLEMVLDSGGESWRAFLFLALQTLLHCMLLGMLAFDYLTLHREGRGWQALFDLYGLPLFGISISSIVLAVGGLLTTLLTSQGAALLTSLMKLIIPDLPNTP